MPHRMEIELTSVRDDDAFTWRAAGARKPKGTVGSSLLPPGAKVGDVVRVEAEVELEGITILCVVPPKEKENDSSRIEVLGTTPPIAAVTTVLAGPSERRRPSRFFDGEDRRPGRPSGERRPSGDSRPSGDRRPGAAGGGRRPGGGTGDRQDREPARDGGRRPDAEDGRDRAAERGARGDGERQARSGAGRQPGGDGRDTARPGAPGTRAPSRPSTSERPPASRRPERDGAGAGGSRPGPAGRGESRPGRERPAPARRGAFRLEPGTAHRDALMETLAPEHRPIGERLAAGGMPAVRKAVADEQERARGEGRTGVSGEAIVALAEGLLADVKAALWLDRAEAAAAHLEELSLRDLRATVLTSSVRDDRGRELERQLREAFERRVTKLRSDWEQQLDRALTRGRVLDALRLSARTPEPTARFPAALIERLAVQAGGAMTADLAPDEWLTLLDAAVECPVRRQIKPAGIPDDPSGEVVRRARLAAGRIPALARMLGMTMPPPPKPLAGRSTRLTRPPRPPKPPSEALAYHPPAVTVTPEVPPQQEEQPAASEAPPAAAGTAEARPSTAPRPPEAPSSAPGAPDPAPAVEPPPSQPVAGEDSVLDEPIGQPVDEG